jgi:hypothetical protein
MPKGIVLLRVCRVQANAGPLNAALPHLLGLFLTEQHAIRAQHDRKALVSAAGGQVKEIFAEERLSSGED